MALADLLLELTAPVRIRRLNDPYDPPRDNWMLKNEFLGKKTQNKDLAKIGRATIWAK